MIPELRNAFNTRFTGRGYAKLLAELERRCDGPIKFRVAETPIFVGKTLLEELGEDGARLARDLIADRHYLDKARCAIPTGVCQWPHETASTRIF